MQTQKIYVHLNYTVGLVKHNKKKFNQTQRMCFHLDFQLSLDKHN